MNAPYGDLIHEHARHPRNYGSLDAPDLRAEGFNPLCGDRVRIDVRLDATGVVETARFTGDLCVIAKAAASLLTERMAGHPLHESTHLDDAEMLTILGVEIQPARRKCALLALEALRLLQRNVSTGA